MNTMRNKLMELEKKIRLLQGRLDYMNNEQYTSFEMEPLENEWNRLMDRLNELRAEIRAM